VFPLFCPTPISASMSEFMHTCIYGLSKLSKVISTILAGRTTKSKIVHVITKRNVQRFLDLNKPM
jgi:hypothetical protein